jgi:hypothetical protein
VTLLFFNNLTFQGSTPSAYPRLRNNDGENNCFANALVQCLLRLPLMSARIEQLMLDNCEYLVVQQLYHLNNANAVGDVVELRNILQVYLDEDYIANPVKEKGPQRKNYRSGQQDAADFYQKLMEYLLPFELKQLFHFQQEKWTTCTCGAVSFYLHKTVLFSGNK